MKLTFADLKEPIQAIHAEPQQMVLEFAGAGLQALSWLHRVGGSSRTLLEAGDRYSPASLIELIGFEPERFTSPQVARTMATQAYIRACHLAQPDTPVAGLGCTATIATDRTKRGNHRCCLAVCDERGVTSYALTMTKGRRTRQEEETMVSLLVLSAMAELYGVTGLPALPLLEEEQIAKQVETVDLLTRLLAGEVEGLVVSPEGRITPIRRWARLAIMSGAFNPLHEGHREMARIAANYLKQLVYFELPLINAAKGAMDVAEARRRIAQFTGWGSVLLTRTPLFSQKAALFPHSVFVLGIDTVQRMGEPRFYNNDPAQMWASFAALRTAGCHFLVAGRVAQGRFLTLKDVDLPDGYRELFAEIPESKFRIDISSTMLRTQSAATNE